MRAWKRATAALALASMVLAVPAWAQSGGTPPRARKASTVATGDEMVKAAQQALRDKGHDPGSVDGRLGPKTQQAIRDYQIAQGLEATGQLDLKTLIALGVEPVTRTSGTGESATAGSASPATAADDARGTAD